MSLDTRLRRLEEGVDRKPELAEFREWVGTLAVDDLMCLLAFEDDPELRSSPPAGVTLEQARARVQALTEAAPEPARRLLSADPAEQ